MKQINKSSMGFITPQTIFLFILVGLLAIFLFSNTNVILSKMGFETTTTLKSQLTKTQGEVSKLVEVNKSNVEELKLERKQNEELKKQLKQLDEVKEKAKDKINEINVRKTKKMAPLMVSLESKEVITKDTITLPRYEIDQLSSIKIDQIHEVFNTLFPVV